MSQESVFVVLEGQCAGQGVCPLSCVEPGTTVCIKQLAAAPELTNRLREMGFCERQEIKVVSNSSNFICQVCNAKLGISAKVADAILVEAVHGSRAKNTAGRKKTPDKKRAAEVSL